MSYDTITKCFVGQPAVGYSCWCGVQFAIPETLYNHYITSNEVRPGSWSLHCPMGHSMTPGGESPAQKEAAQLRDALAREQHHREQIAADRDAQRRRAEGAERQVIARKGVITRLKRRTAAGRCPCCSTQFKDLKAHMSAKHPDWNPDKHAEALEAKVPR